MSFIGALINHVVARENRGIITITGFRGQSLQKILKSIYKTTRVGQYMLNRVGGSFFSFNSFFAPDVYFTLNSIKNEDTVLPKRSIKAALESLMSDTWLSKTNKDYPSILSPNELKQLNVTPLDHQQEFFDIYDKNTQRYGLNGYLLAGAPGSGKTLSGIMLALLLKAEKIIIISPKNALNRVWENTLLSNFHNEPTYSISSNDVLNSTKWTIVHYEYLNKLLENVHRYKSSNTMVILDESHNFNEVKSARTNYFLDFCKQVDAKHILFLSGTPIKAVAAEAIPLLRAIDPLFNQDAEDRYKKIYAGSTSRATEILNNRLGLVSFKVGKERLKLAPPIMKNIQVKMPVSKQFTLPEIKKQMEAYIVERAKYYKSVEAQTQKDFYDCLQLHEQTLSRNERAKYDDYRKMLSKVIRSSNPWDIKEEMVACNVYEKLNIIPSLPDNKRKRFKEVKALVKYTHLVIRGQVLGNIVGRARIQCHIEMAKYLDYETIIESTEKKTVIFTNYVEVLETAANTVRGLGYKPLVVYGGTNSNLKNIIEQFFKDPDANPLIATYASLSTAVPLIAADTMIAIDVPFRQYIIDQAIARIHRLGADTQTTIFYSILNTDPEQNISTRTVDILAWSMQQVNDIIGIESPYEIRSDGGEEMTIGLEDIDISLPTVINNRPVYSLW